MANKTRPQDVQAPYAYKADSTNVLSIELGVEEFLPPKQSRSGLPEWNWRISALNTDKINSKSIGHEPTFREVILAAKTTTSPLETEHCREDLLMALGLWNTDLLDDNGKVQPSCTILISNLSTVLSRILTHPLLLKARQDWDLGEQPEEFRLPVEIHALVSLFGQIWIPERESRSVFGYLYQDPYVGPELKRLFFLPRPDLVAVGFYVGNPVPNHQPVMFRHPTPEEEDFWTDKAVKIPALAFNVNVLRENAGRKVAGAGFCPGLFKTVFEVNPDIEGPDGEYLDLFAPRVNPLNPPPPRPVLHYWTSSRPRPVKKELLSMVPEDPSQKNKTGEDSDWVGGSKTKTVPSGVSKKNREAPIRTSKGTGEGSSRASKKSSEAPSRASNKSREASSRTSKRTREAPSRAADENRYPVRETRSRVKTRAESVSMTSETPSRVVSRELRSRMVCFTLDEEDDNDHA